jgi:hypothetical protein
VLIVAKTKTSSAVKQRYNEKAYDRLAITVLKGQKATIQTAADIESESINGYVKQALGDRTKEHIYEIILQEGKPISFGDFIQKTGFTNEEAELYLDELRKERRIYSVADGQSSYKISLMNRHEYWSADFIDKIDKDVFSLLMAKGSLVLSAICENLNASLANVLHSLVVLIAQRRVLPSLGSELDGVHTPPDMTFNVNPEAAKYVRL